MQDKSESGREEKLCALQKKLGFEFKDKDLLNEALTHNSYANEQRTKSYQRLEYLGDAVLEFIISREMFFDHPECDEGQLTRMRSQVVREESLCRWAKEIGLVELIRLGNSLKKSGANDSVAGDCVEALFGAAFVDGGLPAAEKIVGIYADATPEMIEADASKDARLLLQEFFQKRGMEMPKYETIERTGPDHAPRFKVRLSIEGKILAESWGNSTKDAKNKAAEFALKMMRASF